MTVECFQENVELWSRIHPKEAILIQEVEPKQIPEGIDSIQFESAQIVYLYGISENVLDLTQDWLAEDPKRRLVVLEDQPPIIRRFLEMEFAKDFLEHPQTRLVYFQDLEAGAATLESLYWLAVKAPFQFVAQPLKKKASDLHHTLSYDYALKNSFLEEYFNGGVAFYRNYYSNLKFLPDALLGNHLFGKFQGVPAIICGAGPSLEKQMEHLKQWNDHALIFAGGSALNALQAGGVSPHFGAGIDPNVAQKGRLEKIKDLSYPFFYRGRMFNPALELVKGPKLYVTGAGGYSTADWFEEELGIPSEEIDEGHNVINFSLELAQLMGCDPIIMVGMDLAFTGMKQYSPGVLECADVTEQEICQVEDFNSEALKWKDIHGDEIFTLWKWITEAEWIGDFAKEYPELKLINATEGGIGFPGVPNETFYDVAKLHLDEVRHLDRRIQSSLEECKMPEVTEDTVSAVVKKLAESLERSVSHLETLISETEQAKPPFTQSGVAALAETELSDEPAFDAVLSMFNNVYTKVLQSELEKLNALDSESKADALQQINLKKYQFLQQVAKTNLSILIAQGAR